MSETLKDRLAAMIGVRQSHVRGAEEFAESLRVILNSAGWAHVDGKLVRR